MESLDCAGQGPREQGKENCHGSDLRAAEEKTIQQYTWKGMLSYVGVLPKVTELQKYNIDLDSIDPGIPEGNVCY